MLKSKQIHSCVVAFLYNSAKMSNGCSKYGQAVVTLGCLALSKLRNFKKPLECLGIIIAENVLTRQNRYNVLLLIPKTPKQLPLTGLSRYCTNHKFELRL